jgi:hypothetical protein
LLVQVLSVSSRLLGFQLLNGLAHEWVQSGPARIQVLENRRAHPGIPEQRDMIGNPGDNLRLDRFD